MSTQQVRDTEKVSTTTFDVDHVSPATPKGEYNTCMHWLRYRLEHENRYDQKLTPKPLYEACANNKNLACFKTQCHGFIDTAIKAYANHYPLCISPEAVKLTILQQFAIHVNENAEALRARLVNHEGKKNIIVRRDEFIKGSPTNDWQSVMQEFAETLNADVKDQELVSKILHPTSVSTDITQTAINIAVMDVFQKYYDYTVMTLCGIPSVTVQGTVKDWLDLVSLVEYLAQFDYGWHCNTLIPVLNEFVLAVQGKIELAFWQNIVRTKDNGSGSPKYYGWIKYFFSYNKDKVRILHDEKTCVRTEELSSGISSVPFVWNYFGKEINMMLYAGFAAIGANEQGELYPVITWAIQDIDGSKTNIEIPEKFVQCVNKGCHRSTCLNRYGPGRGMNCDYCRKNFTHVPCVSYSTNSDLCMPCYHELVELMKTKGLWKHEGTEAFFCDLCVKAVGVNPCSSDRMNSHSEDCPDYEACDFVLPLPTSQLHLKKICKDCYAKIKSI
jgi:hypothetical protein